MENTEQTQLMAKEPMISLFLKTVVPIAISLLVAGLYNLIDGIYIARGIGTLAMAGVSMAAPLQMLIAAAASLISTGAASLLARHVGANNPKEAQKVASSSLGLAIVLSLVFTGLGVWYTPELLVVLGVSHDIFAPALDYAQPILIGASVAVILPLLADVFRSEGKVQPMMAMILLASVLNIILDPIFIFALGLGVKGAAIATVLAQFLAILFGLNYYLHNQTIIRFGSPLQLNVKLWWLVPGLGLPIFIAQLGMAAQAGIVNYLFQTLPIDSDLWVGAYGILGRFFGFIFLPLIAMLIGFQTICGFNHGAGNSHRVKQSILVTLKVMTIYCSVLAALIIAFPTQIHSLFTSDLVVLEQIAEIVRITFWTFPFAAISMVATGYYQAIGKAAPSIGYSGLRVFLILIPLALLITPKFGTTGLLVSMPIADIVTGLVILLFTRKDFINLSQPNELTYQQVKLQ